jgi:ADP-heptose:LPS heptosyltransferase
MRKSKIFGSLKSFLSRVLPRQVRLSLLRWSIERACKAPHFVFPCPLKVSARILVIVPADPLLALCQMPGVVAIAGQFKTGHCAVLCERRVAPFFRTVTGISEFIEYDAAEQYLFSRQFDKIGRDVHAGRYEACVVLDTQPDLPLLYVAGKSAASVRIGIGGAGEYPFLNVHVTPTPGRSYLPDKGLLLAASLGVPVRPMARWSVAKESVEEVGQMLQEMKLVPPARLVGIDGPYFYRRFGEKWTQALVAALRGRPCICYFFSHGEPEAGASGWLRQLGVPVLSNLPASRCAALIYKSEFLVAGATVLFELADVLHKPVVGVFEAREFDTFCRESDTTKGLRFDTQPDGGTIESVGRMLDEYISGRASR